MIELIKSYLRSANLLKKRIDELFEEMKREEDQDKFVSLRRRRDILIEERYDLLGTVSEMVRLYSEANTACGED